MGAMFCTHGWLASLSVPCSSWMPGSDAIKGQGPGGVAGTAGASGKDATRHFCHAKNQISP
ncbi:hypothetical protein XOC_2852 [Xanthomonas oryzae pv. oryzicola BLS256]|uniref:Uncharacterized protein n=1 Tax=Xanthomonas oryzae pv. oryzicola (strain BLS256) TaxID=383407 RepID=G7TK26_XANOB|nr:hypothetical protein XOC_2852 [Xanthomonas oryzae pv. oryzicola BLS256]